MLLYCICQLAQARAHTHNQSFELLHHTDTRFANTMLLTSSRCRPVEIAEEFRVLTLQVIGELILSLPPDESERVFPELYVDESTSCLVARSACGARALSFLIPLIHSKPASSSVITYHSFRPERARILSVSLFLYGSFRRTWFFFGVQRFVLTFKLNGEANNPACLPKYSHACCDSPLTTGPTL